MASAVFLAEDDTILVGKQAQHQALFKPDRYEPTPKRSIGLGKVFLGDGPIEVSDLVAGVFRRVYAEACRQQGSTTPSDVRVTHPADWEELRLQVLRRAVGAAGVESATLIAEPVAAAARIATVATEPGQLIAVYDFGGGTFDAAVLRRTDDGFEVAGPPKGRDPLGGEDIDRRIWDHMASLMSDEYPTEWAKLDSPDDDRWRLYAGRLREEIQAAKETLSQSNVVRSVRARYRAGRPADPDRAGGADPPRHRRHRQRPGRCHFGGGHHARPTWPASTWLGGPAGYPS